MIVRSSLAVLGLGVFMMRIAPACATEFPERLRPAQIASLPAERESVQGASEAFLLMPREEAARIRRDPRDRAAYRAVCYAYVADGGMLVRRFAVHVPDREALPFARRAARFLALLWGAANRRFGTLASGLRKTTVEVWMTRSGEAGGEQFRNHLYLYDLLSERTGIEWARELAHEYGHYLLPGASGYTEPENWANGMLGERLFLKWLADDIAAGRLEAAEVPFVRPSDLEDYRAKQVTPLLSRMRTNGPDTALLAKTDRHAMDAFTGLLLYADELYGSAVLFNLLDYLPQGPAARGPDFLHALQQWADGAETLTLTLPSSGEGMVYLPRGTFRVRAVGPSPKTLAIARGATVVREGGGWTARVPTSGWRNAASIGSQGPPILRWERMGLRVGRGKEACERTGPLSRVLRCAQALVLSCACRQGCSSQGDRRKGDRNACP